MSQSIGVYGGPEIVARLRENASRYVFVEGDECQRCRIVIVDVDAADVLPRKSVVRVVLYDGVINGDRRAGDIRVQREAFLANPIEALAVAVDLAGTVIHAAGLETEVAYLTQIHELMTIADANTVSERITRTVLDLLGLTRGTLFLHDPRVERYVVSYSSDPTVRETGEFLPGIPPDLLQRDVQHHLSRSRRSEDGQQRARPSRGIAHAAGSGQAHSRGRARYRQSGALRRRRVLHHPSANRSGAGHRRRPSRAQSADFGA